MRHWLVKGYVLCIILTAVVRTDLCLIYGALWLTVRAIVGGRAWVRLTGKGHEARLAGGHSRKRERDS